MGAPAKETLKRGFWSNESTFEKFCHKDIPLDNPNFKISVLVSFEERPSQQCYYFHVCEVPNQKNAFYFHA